MFAAANNLSFQMQRLKEYGSADGILKKLASDKDVSSSVLLRFLSSFVWLGLILSQPGR